MNTASLISPRPHPPGLYEEHMKGQLNRSRSVT